MVVVVVVIVVIVILTEKRIEIAVCRIIARGELIGLVEEGQ